MSNRHFLTTRDWSRSEIDALLDLASSIKHEPPGPLLEGKTVALLFFNPSLRTRTSMEVGVWRLGGHAVVLEPGKAAWPIEFEDGVVMDGDGSAILNSEIIDNQEQPTQTYGVLVQEGAANTSITENRIEGNIIAPIVDFGTDTVVSPAS